MSYDWIAKYREGGIEALKAKPLVGCPRKLTGRQIDKLYKIITTKSPTQLSFEFALWTRSMVREVIRNEFGVKLPSSPEKVDTSLPPNEGLENAKEN